MINSIVVAFSAHLREHLLDYLHFLHLHNLVLSFFSIGLEELLVLLLQLLPHYVCYDRFDVCVLGDYLNALLLGHITGETILDQVLHHLDVGRI